MTSRSSLPRRALRLVRRLALSLLVLLGGFVALRAWESGRGPGLRPWHTVVPPELDAKALDAADWAGFLAAEDAAFEVVRREVVGRLSPEDRSPANRYDPASPLHPARFATDWNRSFVLVPQDAPRGVAVLLHGMTDAPFSMRHLAALYAGMGYVAVVPRMPGHGTVPGGLAEAVWEQWLAATRLAVRDARARVPHGPLHLVGYSNGGALALRHALDAIEDPRLAQADRVVLVSPMIGVTAFARFAGLAGLPALLPRFAGAAWLSVTPEFIPFKYNSFPVQAARQSYLLSSEVQAQTRRLAAAGQLGRLPPVLTFQSVVDATVSAQALVTALYAQLPANGSELVLFDLNRNAKAGPLVAAGVNLAVEQLLPPAPRRFHATVVTNAGPGSAQVEERLTQAGGTATSVRPLGLAWPREVFSLSHLALAVPVEDALYGLAPDPVEDFGVNLGTLALRGERGVLVSDLDSLLRLTSNPFYPYLRDRVVEAIRALDPAFGTQGAAAGRAAGHAPGPAR
jgi:alpha-beta hydrolase superfamily lysophospholipase